MCVHPELAPALLFPELVNALETASTPSSPVVLPWELEGGSTTRATPSRIRRDDGVPRASVQANVP